MLWVHNSKPLEAIQEAFLCLRGSSTFLIEWQLSNHTFFPDLQSQKTSMVNLSLKLSAPLAGC